ncbi:hypothetical protein [Mycobacterium tuberculosis]|uniref:hypothetical protein n=1 Tax=Mycobacterium tuberculosis TaxID=1773 RepID=UPI00272ABAC0|nr:hypothetical protein [Mycobacterium tuberculosis]
MRRETNLEEINVLGYCVGCTALSTGLAYLAQRGEQLFHSCTLLTTQVDFSLAGDLLLFTEDNQLDQRSFEFFSVGQFERWPLVSDPQNYPSS